MRKGIGTGRTTKTTPIERHEGSQEVPLVLKGVLRHALSNSVARACAFKTGESIPFIRPGTTVLTAFDNPIPLSLQYVKGGGGASYCPVSAITDRLYARNQFMERMRESYPARD